MSKTLNRVLIMAGGTGGHVFPGLALAHYLREKDIEVHWLGTERGLEARLVPEAAIPLHYITVAGIRGKTVFTQMSAVFKMLKAIWQARKIIKQVSPDVVIGMGGFVSGPGGVASWFLGVPLIIHEQNAKAGFTNQILAFFARRVLEGFPATFNSRKALAIGNPVRAEIECLPSPSQRFNQKKPPLRLLVIGGSLGAQALNELLPQALATLPTEERPLVLHQTGEKHFSLTKKAYEAYGIEVTLKPFIAQIAEAYAWADMVICRAGALTVSELCSAGLGAIFVPFPYAVDDHQTANAYFMVKHHAALCIQQKVLTPERLAELIKEYTQAPEKCLAMANAAYSLRQEHVAQRIFDILAETVTLKLS